MQENKTDKIYVRNLNLEMFLGVREREQKDKQKVVVSIEAQIKRPEATQDLISTTVSYTDLIEKTREIASSSQFGLAESFAEEIARRCLEDKRITKITIRVDKPEASPWAETVGVEIIRPQSTESSCR